MNQAGDFPLSRMDARHVIDILDANALRLRPQEIAEATQAMIPAKSRGRIRDLAGGWPVALDLLCAWSATRSEEHTSELQSLMRISYAVFCLKKKTQTWSHNFSTTAD